MLAQQSHRYRKAAWLVLLCLIPACGLRVDKPADSATDVIGVGPGPATENGDVLPDGSTNPVAGTTGDLTGSTTGTGQLPGSTSTFGPGGATTSGSTGSVTRGVVQGRGVTSTEIRIGFAVSEDLQAGFAAVGATGSPPDEHQIVEALVKWVNSTGGIAGRKLVPIYHSIDQTEGTWATQAEAACATFTQDNQVFAVHSSPVGGNDSLAACLAGRKTPLLEQNLWLFDAQYYKQYAGYLYQPGRASATRWVKAYAQGLSRQDFFKTGKAALLRFDAPVYARLESGVLRPTLTRLGHKLDRTITISQPGGLSDFGGMAAQLNNAILELSANGVDHVLFLENAGIMPFFFMAQAESQGYRPSYGLSSVDIPTTLQGQHGPEQLSKAVGVGWTPGVDSSDDDGDGNPMHILCRDEAKKRGVENLSAFYVQTLCDSVLFLRHITPRLQAFTPAGLRAAVEALGTSYRSSVTPATRFGPGRYDGAEQVRYSKYYADCECFKYYGPRYPM